MNIAVATVQIQRKLLHSLVIEFYLFPVPAKCAFQQEIPKYGPVYCSFGSQPRLQIPQKINSTIDWYKLFLL